MIGRVKDLEARGAIRGREQTLIDGSLPRFAGDVRAQVRQNLGQLRDYARQSRKPIRDASPHFERTPRGTGHVGGDYLGLERNELRKLGYRRVGNYWFPTKKTDELVGRR